jgi:flavin-dependent dehydrogenase
MSAGVHDVAVVGSGPAGATAARLLAEWGHSVVLLTRRGEGAPLAESLPPSTRKILAETGALALVENAGFLRTTGNTSWWGTALPRVASFAGEGHGWQVLRSALEVVLRRGAVSGGVLVRDARVREVRREGGVFQLVTERADDPRALESVRARQVVDASGRAGVVARRSRRAAGPRTLAVSAVLRNLSGFRVPDDTHTLVEAHDAGWAWSVPVARGERHLTVMLDPPAREFRPRDLRALFTQELQKAPRLRTLCEGAQQVGRVVALDASPYTSASPAEDGVVLVGDAASFIDPLSSFGVKKALFSGWLGAVATHTALVDRDRSGLALAFYAGQEQRISARYAREAAGFAAEAAARYEGSIFWTARAALGGEDVEERPLAPEEDIRAAFERMRSRDRLRLCLAEDTTIASAPAVRGREIVRSEALLGPNARAVQFLDGVSAPVLGRLLAGGRSVGALCEAYDAAAPRVELGVFLRAVATLLAAGFLRDCDE